MWTCVMFFAIALVTGLMGIIGKPMGLLKWLVIVNEDPNGTFAQRHKVLCARLGLLCVSLGALLIGAGYVYLLLQTDSPPA